MIQWITDLLATNQVFSGGAVLMVGGGLVAYLRNTPRKIMGFLRRFLVMEVYIPDSDPAFNWVLEWLAAQPYSKERAMNLAVSTKYIHGDRIPGRNRPWSNDDDDGEQVAILTPARGQHMLWHNGYPIWVTREMQEGTGASEYSPPKEALRLLIPTRNRQWVMNMLATAKLIAQPPADDRVFMYRLDREDWCLFTKRQPRPVESVILRDGLLEDLIADIEEFRSKRDWYIERGIPYRKGLLLYGPPGTGKSSSILAIASKLKMSVCVCNPAAAGVTDHALLVALANTPPDSLVLIEDVDAAFNENRQSSDDKNSTLTFGGLLNAIDGVAAGDGRLIIATTNHIEKIDAALIRHGRFDRKELIDYPTADQVERMFKRFFPESIDTHARDFARKVLANPQTSAAAVQAHLLQYFDNAFQALEMWESQTGSLNTELP